jgi:hypothetical protein
VLKTRSFTECSDIIHDINASMLFDTDMRLVLEAFREFQDLLAVVLERLNLPLSYLYHTEDSGREATPRSGRDPRNAKDLGIVGSQNAQVFEPGGSELGRAALEESSAAHKAIL